jgi:hypothetical protein
MSEILKRLLTFRQQIQLYHWSTSSYSRHIASGTLYDNLSKLIDQFVEVLQGRIVRVAYKKLSLKLKNLKDKEITEFLVSFKNYLEDQLGNDLKVLLKEKEATELLNIRDEMLSTINQTIYLFSLS